MKANSLGITSVLGTPRTIVNMAQFLRYSPRADREWIPSEGPVRDRHGAGLPGEAGLALLGIYQGTQYLGRYLGSLCTRVPTLEP